LKLYYNIHACLHEYYFSFSKRRASMKKYIAELLGTFILTLAVISSLAGTFPVATPVIAGLALGLGVYTMGGISGAHFNPAITLGVLSIKKISLKDAGIYILAQLVGAALAMLLAQHCMELAQPDLAAAESMKVGGAEALGAFVFAFGVAAAVHGRISAGASGLAVGGSLLLGIALAAAGTSNGVLNPAVALGIGSFSFSYLLGPIVGAALAMLLYRFLSE
jgi:aquaporin Z